MVDTLISTKSYFNKMVVLKVKKTVLIIVEGFRDKLFIKHIQDLYLRSSDIFVRVRNGMGGTADGLVEKTILDTAAVDCRFTFLDNDKPVTEMNIARKLAVENEIDLIECTPCIERLMLEILEYDSSSIPSSSLKCKKIFEGKFLNKGEDEDEIFKKIFPKKLLSYKRKTIPILNKLILIMEI